MGYEDLLKLMKASVAPEEDQEARAIRRDLGSLSSGTGQLPSRSVERIGGEKPATDATQLENPKQVIYSPKRSIPEELVQAKMQQMDMQPKREPASIPDENAEPEEMKRARGLLKFGLNSGQELDIKRNQPKVYEYYQRMKYSK